MAVSRASRAKRSPDAPDKRRLRMFRGLRRALLSAERLVTPPGSLAMPPGWNDGSSQAARDFFENWFTNWVEGARVPLDKAWVLLRAGDARAASYLPVAAGCLRGMQEALQEPSLRVARTGKFDDFVEQIRSRHQLLMRHVPEAWPGRFKAHRNGVGRYEFVEPRRVLSTLEEGFSLFAGLENPFTRAAGLHYVLTETHPFVDGNGRSARLALNAEMEAGGQPRLLHPIGFHRYYCWTLASMENTATPYYRALDWAQRWTLSFDWSASPQALQSALSATRAMRDPSHWLAPSHCLVAFGPLGDPRDPSARGKNRIERNLPAGPSPGLTER